ncbi:MAG: radical SAM protein [Candidatus Omnitrophica bacterium]|nr:radical SAM protein [Candidatus Omnitrophota bacterium]
MVFWESTAGCNLACRHCRRLEVSRALSRKDLTTPQVVRYLIGGLLQVGRPVLVCSGGEPLLRPDLFDIAWSAVEAGLPIALATNGTLIDESMANRIVAAKFERVAISVDGADAATHDAFRQQRGAFDAAVEGLRRLRERGMSLQVNTTVTQHNVRELDALYERVMALGVEAWHVFMFVPVGCGLEIPAEQQLAAEQYERVLTWLADRAEEQRLFVRATCAPQYFRILAGRKSFRRVQSGAKFATLTKGCLAGTGICFISHQGEVFPCGYLPVSSGNITGTPFAQIWRESPVFAALRQPECLEGKCGACEFKRVCSGCRARAYALTGNYLAEEPCCSHIPKAAALQVV